VSVFIEMERKRFGVEPICAALGVSASAYYQRATGERSVREVEDERLLARIRGIHERNYFAYGSWRMWRALRRAGEEAGRGQVERLMRANGIQGAKRRGKPWRTTRVDAAAKRPPDLVQRAFTAAGPDQLWCADFTYLRCWEGAVFFSFVIDVYSRAVVGWQFADHMRTDLVLDALRMALAQRDAGADIELVHHSDAGSQLEFNRSSQHWPVDRAYGTCLAGDGWSRVGDRGGGVAAGAIADAGPPGVLVWLVRPDSSRVVVLSCCQAALARR